MSRWTSALFLSGAVLFAALGGTGCDQKPEAPKVPEPPKATGKPEALPPDLLTIKAEMTQAKGQIDVTVAKLEILAASSASYDKPAEEVVAAAKALETAAEGLRTRSKDMRERGAAYFEAWEKQLASMSTPDVVARATKRKEELSKHYAEVLTAMQAARSAYDVFWTDIQATLKAIDEGLTADKVKLLAEPVAKIKSQAGTLKERISSLSAKLDQIGVLYTAP